jgi:ABC-type phosphate transport system substrate-binding protein
MKHSVTTASLSILGLVLASCCALAGTTAPAKTPHTAKNSVSSPGASSVQPRVSSPPRGAHGAGGDRGSPTVRDHRDGVGRGRGGAGGSR